MRNTCFAICVFLIAGCTKGRLDVDTINITIPGVKINRLEQDLFNISPDSVQKYTPLMIKKYGKFYVRFVANIINKGGMEDSSYAFNLKQFISDADMRRAYNYTQTAYPDIAWMQDEFNNAFKHFKYYFPKRLLPSVTTIMSGFNYSIVNVDSVLGIGLEMYLGSENEMYRMLQLPKYKTTLMRKEYILPDAIKGWMATEFENKMNKPDFLSEIIYQGKIMYLTDALLPGVDDSLKIGYTKVQLEWCNKNEGNMWGFFLDQQLLYSTNYAEISKFTSDAPFTAAFNKESPGRVGTWIGWQIVRKFMDKNEKITVKELMELNDAQFILNKSKYKPGR
jgi:gliding motility-associated lipoprotein GldB